MSRTHDGSVQLPEFDLPAPSQALVATYHQLFPAKPMVDVPTLHGGPPQVVAHRGASYHQPEHTLEAYELAIDSGADALEADVRLTADGHLVCVHDRLADRTSSGFGAISSLELAHLEGLDWGSWKQRISPLDTEIPDRAASRLLTLRQLLRTALAAERPIDLAIETKHPSKHTAKVEETLGRVLAEFGLDEPRAGGPNVRVMSFSLPAVLRMRYHTPHVPLAWLMEGVVSPRAKNGRMPRGIAIAAISIGMLRRNPHFVEQQHACGREVHVWTVDSPDDITRCLRGGVDAIITNRTALARQMVDTFWAPPANM